MIIKKVNPKRGYNEIHNVNKMKSLFVNTQLRQSSAFAGQGVC